MDQGLWLIPLLAGAIGVLLGSLVVYFALKGQMAYQKSRQKAWEEKKNKQSEEQVLLLLNAKINEILMKRQQVLPSYVAFDNFSDTFIDIEDYVYLQSLIAQNFYFLPNFVKHDFLKELSPRKMVLTPDETIEVGGYIYQGGRLLLERFSEDLITLVEEKYHSK